MRKFFASERFDVNRCGPRNESYPMFPSVPQAGRENPAMVGRAMLHWLGLDLHVPGVNKVSPGRVQVLVGSVGSGIVVKTGVNQVRFPPESRFAPSLSAPAPMLGRQTLVFSSLPNGSS